MKMAPTAGPIARSTSPVRDRLRRKHFIGTTSLVPFDRSSIRRPPPSSAQQKPRMSPIYRRRRSRGQGFGRTRPSLVARRNQSRLSRLTGEFNCAHRLVPQSGARPSGNEVHAPAADADVQLLAMAETRRTARLPFRPGRRGHAPHALPSTNSRFFESFRRGEPVAPLLARHRDIRVVQCEPFAIA